MTAVAVIKGRSVLFGVAGKTRLPVQVIIKINFCGTFLESKQPGVADFAASLHLVAFMSERDRFFPCAEMDGFLRNGNGFLMTAGAVAPGKRFFTLLIMTGKAVLVPAVIRHADRARPFSGGKEGRMAALAFWGMLVMIKHDAFDASAQRHCSFERGNGFSSHPGAEAKVTSRALRIGSKSFLAVMTGAAVFPLIQGIHDEIFILLSLECLHGKQAAVAGAAREFFLRVVLMAENDGFQGFGIKNAGF